MADPAAVCVFASGGGSNLQALLDALGADAPARVTRVVSNRSGAGALERARRVGVEAVVLRDPTDPAEVGAAVGNAQLIVLAGYLKLVPPEIVARFRWRLINIHPALLPAFGGAGMYGRRVHEAVLASGARVTGATVHYVDEQYDRGPIIAQWPVPVRTGDTPDTLAARVLAIEHQLLPRVVWALAELGVPGQPVQLTARGEAFSAAARGDVAVLLDRRTESETNRGETG